MITKANIQHALEYIPSDDRDTWLKMGMSIKSELGDAGFSMWDYWSQSSATYKERDARHVWQSLKGNGLTIRTLLYTARSYGWQQSPDYKPKPIPTKKPPKQRANTFGYALSLWTNSNINNGHPYALSKGINWHAGANRGIASGKLIGRNTDALIIPIRNIQTGDVKAVQCINCEGKKQTFGSLSGNSFYCGNMMNKAVRWFVVEGWADAISIVFHHYKGNAVAFAACGKSCMQTLANSIAETYSPNELDIIEDAI